MGVVSDPLLDIEEVGGGSPIPLSSTEEQEDTDRGTFTVDLNNKTYLCINTHSCVCVSVLYQSLEGKEGSFLLGIVF